MFEAQLVGLDNPRVSAEAAENRAVLVRVKDMNEVGLPAGGKKGAVEAEGGGVGDIREVGDGGEGLGEEVGGGGLGG